MPISRLPFSKPPYSDSKRDSGMEQPVKRIIPADFFFVDSDNNGSSRLQHQCQSIQFWKIHSFDREAQIVVRQAQAIPEQDVSLKTNLCIALERKMRLTCTAWMPCLRSSSTLKSIIRSPFSLLQNTAYLNLSSMPWLSQIPEAVPLWKSKHPAKTCLCNSR